MDPNTQAPSDQYLNYPTQEEFLPKPPTEVPQQDFIPQQQDFIPQQQDFIPQQQDFTPQQQDFAPQPQGFAPQPQGFAPQPQGFAPQPQGFVVQPQGFIPQQQGVMQAQPVYLNQPIQQINPIFPPEPGVTYPQPPMYVVSPVGNQLTPTQNIFNPTIFATTLKSESKIITCPYCQAVNFTRVDQSCNCGNVCCCLCASLVCWAIFQLARDKDVNCYDAKHYCKKCKQLIYSYSAC